MTRTDIINYLIRKYNYKSYLEIGLDTGVNYERVQCDSKASVDPFFREDHNGHDLTFTDDIPQHIKDLLTYRLTSDCFFEQNTKTYDIIFVDGLHLEEQVGKDIINGLKVLNPGGIIVVHDCLPGSELMQTVPRISHAWNGSVWKAVYELIQQGLDIQVVDTDWGCGLIRYCDNSELLHYPKKSEATWNDFKNNRNEMMHVISKEDFLKLY